MKVQAYQHGPLFYAVIDEMYNQQEIVDINKELVFLEMLKKPANKSNTATENGVPLKTGHGLFIDKLYSDRNSSIILHYNRRLFDPRIVDELAKSSCFYDHLRYCSLDTTLINFYQNDEVYKPHADSSILTALTFFEIGNVKGGALWFSDYNIKIDFVVGRTVIFPGCARHNSDPVEEGTRITMAQFTAYKPD